MAPGTDPSGAPASSDSDGLPEPGSPFSLFEVYGIEIEYAVVRSDTLAVDPSADKLLETLGGNPDSHPAADNVEADNELAAHVLELKATRPARDLAAQARDFAAYARRVNRALAQWGCRLMPGGMHPTMDPSRESRIWPHEDNVIYETYHRLFDVRGHGWFNIQSTHLNLPFRGDAEFSALHNAISLLLPALPALAASSPFHDGVHHGWLDGRLRHYVGNQRRLPEIIGDIIPEPVGSEAEYRERILQPMYRAIAPLDTEGIMQEEWLNSRAAIARFSRGSIEIRCMDSQECPRGDLALCHWAGRVLKMMIAGGGDLLQAHRQVPAGLLKGLFLESARIGTSAAMPAAFPYAAFGVDAQETVGDFLGAVSEKVFGADAEPADAAFLPHISRIFSDGSLAERLLRAAGPAPDPERLRAIYGRLCDCLEFDRPFTA